MGSNPSGGTELCALFFNTIAKDEGSFFRRSAADCSSPRSRLPRLPSLLVAAVEGEAAVAAAVEAGQAPAEVEQAGRVVAVAEEAEAGAAGAFTG
jgi:hypothetical protein